MRPLRRFRNVEEINRLAERTIYYELEHSCSTEITDEDMIRLHIDFALENNDKEAFLELSNLLKGLTV